MPCNVSKTVVKMATNEDANQSLQKSDLGLHFSVIDISVEHCGHMEYLGDSK